MGSDDAWRRAARVALLVIAGLTASAAPRSPFSSPAPAAAAPSAVSWAAQASDPDTTADDEDDVDEEKALPVPVFEDEKPTPPPASGNVAPRDSAAILRMAPPDSSAPAETLLFVPPGGRPTGAGALPAKPGDEPAPIVKKQKSGLFGLPGIFVILGLTVVHVMVVRTVTD